MSTTWKCIIGGMVLTSALLYTVLEWHHVFKILVRIPIVGWLVEYNLPPTDFYVPLDKTSLRTGFFSLKFVCKYRGRHEIRISGIRTERDKVVSYWNSNVGMNVVVRSEDGRILYQKETANTRILGGSNGRFNYCYGIFNAPQDVPLGAELIADIRCYGAVEELLHNLPDAEIVVVKVFDK